MARGEIHRTIAEEHQFRGADYGFPDACDLPPKGRPHAWEEWMEPEVPEHDDEHLAVHGESEPQSSYDVWEDEERARKGVA